MDSKYKMIKPLLGTLIDTNVCLPQGPLVNPVNTLRALWNLEFLDIETSYLMPWQISFHIQEVYPL